MEINMPLWIRKLFSPRHRTIRKALCPTRLAPESLEERLAPAGNLFYEAVSPAPLTLRLSGNTVEVVNTNTSGVLASKALSEISTGVLIEGDGFNVNLTIDDSVPVVAGGILFVGGSGTNTLIGPDAAATWGISGDGTGTLTFGSSSVTFNGVENLRGGSNAGAFTMSSIGSVDGTIDGGDGADTLVGANVENTWTLTDVDAGEVAWSVTAGPVVTPFTQAFVQIENLTGGS